ncbi:uncharacterized protein LOC103988727 isoform X1 [Musa acuminata AAA Group]|uniref:uncharacterized protein LOC103988727 isoform X1 n=2 Tax=Musa acuminata AAA Group TaxID=214697 RepID=UPI0031D6083D
MHQMPQKEDATNDDGGSVKIGTTGTIGSLMTREIESMKQASSSAQRKQQTGPVSVPCGANPRKALQRRNQTNEYGSTGSSSSGTGHTHCSNHEDAQKSQHTPRKKGHRHAPILRSDDSPTNRNMDTDKVEKKVHTYMVKVVDLKCGNPMSSRLKKLSFSKLSESIS